MPPEAAVPAGWYPDPRDASQARYWDGGQWTQQTRQVKAPSAPSSAQSEAPVFMSQATASVPEQAAHVPQIVVREDPIPFAVSTQTVPGDKGFFKSLFDFSFTSMVTPKFVKVLYGIAIFFISVGTIALVVSAFNDSTAVGVVAFFILGPLYFLVNLLVARVFMEFLIVVFRILDTNRELVELAKRG